MAAVRTTASIAIDGDLNEAAWKDAPLATDFVELRPTPFRKEEPATRTEVYLLYSNEGIYIGGYLHEKTKDSIAMELNGRDGFGNNDFIGVIFDTYKDKLNAFEYFVTPLGEQMDAKVSPSNDNSEDFGWNAVWKSGVKIHDDGWSFEMFLPLSAIRFSTQKVQDWGFNIVRRRQKTQQQSFWNPLDPTVNGFLTQEGFWTGLENIKPPIRLQFSPYFSTYINHYPFNEAGKSNFSSSVNGGMDVKYGISQAITLDMTLIPDFGQVQSDNRVLNLTPFEVKYNEYRSFFTEGTELFNKGNLFYSRRVGGTPMHYGDVYGQIASNETVLKNPGETKLYNATKVSGRLQSGLGIGVFNAVTAPQYATIQDDKGHERRIETNPLSNYNIVVLNQSLKNNSSVSLINTNVLRSGHDYDANVTAALFDLNDKKNTWNVGGKFASSNLSGYLPGGKTQSGYSHNLYFGKTSGRFNFNISQDLTNAKFNSNDFGYFTNNNFIDHSLWMGYHWTKPSKWYNRFNLNYNFYYSRRLQASVFQSASTNINANGQLKNLWFVGGLIGYEPRGNDFYEPRIDHRFFRGWASHYFDAWFETNGAKKYSVYGEFFYVNRHLYNGSKYQFTFNQKYRFSNKFSLSLALMLQPERNNVGFATIENGNSVFGLRNRNTIDNVLEIKYNFNNKMGITTRIRHYWSRVDYKQYFDLQADGTLTDKTNFTKNTNQNYNAFNVDAVYTWQFAPGSFINIVWKNSIDDFDQTTSEGYFKNLNKTLGTDQNNNLSFKILYFLDYLQLKKHHKVQ